MPDASPGSREERRPELCDVRKLDLAQCLITAKTLEKAAIRAGTRVGDVWKTGFRSLARSCSGDVAIVDRYCLERHMRPVGGQSGLHEVLSRLSEDLPGRPVVVYCNEAKNRNWVANQGPNCCVCAVC